MGNRAVQAGLVVVFLVFGVVAALALNGGHKNNNGPTASASPSVDVTPSVAASPSASESASPSAAPSVAPSAAPSESPSAQPAPTQTTQPAGTGTGTSGGGSGCSTAGSGGAGPYPRQLNAGATYDYCGPRFLVAHATASEDRPLNSVCAGVNLSSQSFPAGYRGVFFVGAQFPDGQIVSAGYTRDSGGANRDFASIQNANGTNQRGTQGADPGAGSHNYCVTRTGSQWLMTRDGVTIYQTSEEPATTLAGATLKFDSDVQNVGGAAAQRFTFTIPGFHDISVGGQPPRQLRGATFYS